MRVALSLLLVLTTALTRSGRVAAQILVVSRTKQLVGCYALFAGGKALDTSYYNSSPRVLLDSTVFEMTVDSLPPLRWTVLDRLDAQGRLIELGRSSLPPRWWVDSANDSLHLSFVDRSGGAVLVLESIRVSDTLRGRIENHRELVGPSFVTNRQSALAVRVPCHSSAHP
jgi:hypothetical protein